MGIVYNGRHTGFASLVANGEASFYSLQEMTTFVRGLNSIYTEAVAPQPTPFFRNPVAPPVAPPPPNPFNTTVNNNILNYTATSPSGKRMDFAFKYEKVGANWRVYITQSPSYGSRLQEQQRTY
jgi:hypothetical protein